MIDRIGYQDWVYLRKTEGDRQTHSIYWDLCDKNDILTADRDAQKKRADMATETLTRLTGEKCVTMHKMVID